MAKSKLNLHAYQQDILARLQRVKEHAEQGGASKLGVKFGGAQWLVSMADIAEALPVPELTAVPLTQPWFLGLANLRGNLYGINDLVALAGLGLTKINRDSRILLVNDRFDVNVALLVSGLVGLRNLDDMQLLPKAEQGPVWQVQQYQDKNGEIWGELDVYSLLNEQAFMHIAA